MPDPRIMREAELCADAKQLGVALPLFQRFGWLVPDGTRAGRRIAYRLGADAGTGPMRPDRRHPQEFAQLLAEERNER